MTEKRQSFPQNWLADKRRRRGRRALERQLEYQKSKAEKLREAETEILFNTFARARVVRQKLEAVKPIAADARIIEVGSGAHGLIFGFGDEFGVGIDPLAVEYKRLFPKWQTEARTIAAIGEELPLRTLRSMSSSAITSLTTPKSLWKSSVNSSAS